MRRLHVWRVDVLRSTSQTRMAICQWPRDQQGVHVFLARLVHSLLATSSGALRLEHPRTNAVRVLKSITMQDFATSFLMDPWASFLNWNATALSASGDKLPLTDSEGVSLDQSQHCDTVDSLDLESVGHFSDFTGGFRLASKFNNLKILSVAVPKHAPYIQWPLRPEFLPSSLTSLSLKFAGSVDALLFFMDLGSTLPNLTTLSIIDDIKTPFIKRALAGARYPPVLTSLLINTCRFSPSSAILVDEAAVGALPITLASLEFNGAAGKVDHNAKWPLNLTRLLIDPAVKVDPSALPATISHLESTLNLGEGETSFDWKVKLPNLTALISPAYSPHSGALDAAFISKLPQGVRKLHLRGIQVESNGSTDDSQNAGGSDVFLPEPAQTFINQLEELYLDQPMDARSWKLFPGLQKLQTTELAAFALPSRLTTLIVARLIDSIAPLPSTLTLLMANGGYSLTPSADSSKSKFEMLPSSLKTLRIGQLFTSDHATTFPTSLEFLSLSFGQSEDDNQQLWDSLYLLPNLTSLGMMNHTGEMPPTARLPPTLKVLSFAGTNALPFDWWKTQLPLATSLETLSTAGWVISPNYLHHLPSSLRELIVTHIDAVPVTSDFAALPRSLRSLDIRSVRCATDEAREAMQAFQGYSAETLRALPPLAALKIPGLLEFMDVHLGLLPRGLHEFSAEEEDSRCYFSSLYLNLLHPHHMRVMDSLGLSLPNDQEPEA